MKKILLVCLAFLLILPASSAFSVTVDWTAIFADHRSGESGPGDIGKEILVGIGLVDQSPGDIPALYTAGPAGPIINTNPPTAINTGYLDDGADFFPGVNDYEKFYDAGNPSDLAKFENTSFTFQLYNSGSYVKPLWTINTPEFGWLDFISLDNTPQGVHPTFEWQDVPNADQYRVRIMSDTAPVAIVDEMRFNAGFGSYSYQYMGDGFNQYDDAYVRLEALEFLGGNNVNRSILFQENPVPEPTTMLLFGAGLVGLAGFGRKKFKK